MWSCTGFTCDAHLSDGSVSSLAVSAHLHQVLALLHGQIDGLLHCGVQHAAGLPLRPVQDLSENSTTSRADRTHELYTHLYNTFAHDSVKNNAVIFTPLIN